MENSKVTKFKLEGTVVATQTPMTTNGSINFDIFEPYVKFLSQVGVGGIFVNGSLGEGMSLTIEERQKTAEKWVAVSKGSIKHIVIHVGADNLRDTVTLAKHASELGVDAIASICSVYFKPRTLQELVAYTEQVAQAAPNLPFYYYDIDFMTGVHFDASEFLKLAKDRIPNLCGLKYTTPKLNIAYLCSKLYDGFFQVAIGTDDQCLPYLSVGLDVTITDTVYASLHVQLKKVFYKKNNEAARKYQDMTAILAQIINKYGAVVPVVKEIVSELIGVDMGPCRLPMMRLSPEKRGQLIHELRSISYFDSIIKIKH